MEIKKCTMDRFYVIGKEGSTDEGEGFVARLWKEANADFGQIADLVLRDEQGLPVGIWGLMTDFSRSYAPWEEGFTKGLYLAGAQVAFDAVPPEGWVKWESPAYEFIYVQSEGPQTVQKVLDYMEQNALFLCGAIYDHSCPKDGKDYMFFPIKRL
ncbi:MAG: GyrI-like domain-containing protein [Eubacteriaceae bacterium]|nr:GyrI-like domain-containing protein [Eubacteriaceae bacterium]